MGFMFHRGLAFNQDIGKYTPRVARDLLPRAPPPDPLGLRKKVPGASRPPRR